MYRSIEIDSFRGIRHSRIDGLQQVNLFFGKNNCGKSSMLDAIFLISGMSNPKLPININLLRNYQRIEASDMLLDFYALDASSPIRVKAYNDEERELQISLFESADSNVGLLDSSNNISSTEPDNQYGIVLKYEIDGQIYESSLQLKKLSDTELQHTVKQDARYKEAMPCRYLNPKFDFYTSIEGLGNVLKNKDESFIVEALRLIEPQLNDFVLSRQEVLVDIGLGQRIPINMMGDGTRKLLSILTTIYECKNGIVLIDEISNGFHHSVMKGLWEAVMSAAEKNNVQIFATTHDLDSIKGLRDAALHGGNGQGVGAACFKLQRTKDAELKAYHYSLDSIDYSLNQEIEIR
jgi:AAA15 family ATPase/GTPase